MTYLMPSRFIKNGTNRINTTSDICEIDNNTEGYFTTKLSVYSGMLLNESKNGLPKVLVICKIPPRNTAKIKKIAILGSLNNTNASKPKELAKDFLFELSLVMFINGSVNEYKLSKTEPAAAI